MATHQFNLPSITWPRYRPVSSPISDRFSARPNARSFLTVLRLCMITCAPPSLFERFVEFGASQSMEEDDCFLGGAKEEDTVLDVCCGSGDLAFLLSEKVGIKGKVIALDFSKEQLQVAKSIQRERLKACYNNIEGVEGKAVDLPFSDTSFDAATIGYGLRNIIDRRKGLMEMSQSCFKPWFKSIRSRLELKHSSIYHFDSGDELEKLALESGFSAAKHFEMNFSQMGNLVATR